MKTNIFSATPGAIVHYLLYIFCFAIITSCSKQISDIPAAEDNTERSGTIEASPTVKFTFPKKEDTVFDAITIKIKATSDVAIDSVQCKIDGVWYGSKTAAPYNFDWNTTSVMNGAHQLEATVFDHAGNSRTKKMIVHVLNTGVLSFEQELLQLINTERNHRGIASLIFNSKIFIAARSHAQDMADNYIYGYTGSDGSDPWDRLLSAGYQYTAAAEIISGQKTAAIDVFNAWMANAGLRTDMLDPVFKDAAVGCGYNFKTNYQTYWVLDLGSTQ